MTVSPIVKIGSDEVSIESPCDVALALRKVELAVVSGDRSETVELGGEKVTFTRANSDRLAAMIQTYQSKCDQASGARVRRSARGVRWR